MARQEIDIGVEGNDGTGDSIRESFRKVNTNFQELYAVFGLGGSISFKNIDDTPDSYLGNQNAITAVNSTETAMGFYKFVSDAGDNANVKSVATNNNSVFVEFDDADPAFPDSSGTVKIVINDPHVERDPDPAFTAPLNSQAVMAYSNALNTKLRNTSGTGDDIDTLVTNWTDTHTGASAITADNIVISKGYADDTYVNVAGDTMTGHLNTVSGATGTQVPQTQEVITRAGSVANRTMQDTLYLSDHPNPIEGFGTPNGPDDLQAVTKLYVDTQGFSSSANLYVSTTGDDLQRNTPAGQEGAAPQYAYKSINAAMRRAEQIIESTPFEPGPYVQVITYGNNETNTTITDLTGYIGGPATADAANDIAVAAINQIQEDVAAYLASNYPDLGYDKTLCFRDIKLMIDSVRLDVAAESNYLSRWAGLRYNANPSAVKARTTQYQATADSIALVRAGLVSAFNDANTAVPGTVSSTVITEYQTRFGYILDIIDDGEVPDSFNLSTGNGYVFNFDNGSNGSVDQGVSGNKDLIEGKVIRGRTSGAIGLIQDYQRDQDTGISDRIVIDLLEPIEFIAGEELEYGNITRDNHITVRVESGIYYEQLPIKLPENVSIKGDEFRRVVLRPKPGVSQSKWANTYFYRDIDIDGLPAADSPIFQITNQSVADVNRGPADTYVIGPDDYTTTGIGQDATFSVVVDGTGDCVVTITDGGTGFIIGETITIPNANLGGGVGAADLTFDVQTTSGGYHFTHPISGKQGKYGYHYATDSSTPVNVGTDGADNPGNFKDASRLIELNKEFIAEEVIQWIDAQIAGGAGIWAAFTYNATKCRRDTRLIVDGLVNDLREGGRVETLVNQAAYYNGSVAGQEQQTEAAIEYIKTISVNVLANDSDDPFTALGSVDQVFDEDYAAEAQSSTNLNALIDCVNFAFDAAYNPPKNNSEMDVLLCNDGTIVRNLTVQRHGGFMMALDPEGQILTKSPYCQTGSSFSQSKGTKRSLAGGLFADGYAGNMPAEVDLVTSPTEIRIQSPADQGLFVRKPPTPFPFFYNGARYQVNYIKNYDQANGRATLILDETSNNNNGWTDPVPQDIFVQSGGNRSMLSNDFTQVNDLGYGALVINNALSELVSMFTYYCHTGYLAKDGSQIRSIAGNNSYGFYGLVSEGSDPDEIPNSVTLDADMVFPAKTFRADGYLDFGSAVPAGIAVGATLKQGEIQRTITGVTNASPAVVTTSVNHTFNDGDTVTIDNVVGMTELNGRIFYVKTTATATEFELYTDDALTSAEDSSAYNAYSAGGTATRAANATAIVSFKSEGDTRLFIHSSAGIFNTTNSCSTTAAVAGVPTTVVTQETDAAEGDLRVYAYDLAGFPLNIGEVEILHTSGLYQPYEITNASNADFTLNGYTIDQDASPGSIVGGTFSGTGAVFEISKTKKNGYDVRLITGGTGFADGETFVIDGGVLGGTTTTNDCTVVVTTEASVITSIAVDAGSNPPDVTDASVPAVSGKVWQLNLGTGIEGTAENGLQEDTLHDDLMVIRHKQNIVVRDFPNEELPVRPSTAFVFTQDTDSYTYRTIDFGTDITDGVSTQGTQKVVTFDANFRYIDLTVVRERLQDLETVFLGNHTVDPNYTDIVTDATPSASLTMGDTATTAIADGSRFIVINQLDETAQSRIANADMIFAWGGKTHLVEAYAEYVNNSTSAVVGVIQISDLANSEVHPDNDGRSGLAEGLFQVSAGVTLKGGLQEGEPANITVNISTCRATGHDMLDIGVGGYNTANYPERIFGAPFGTDVVSTNDAIDSEGFNNAAQAQERNKGRVFTVMTDQDGFFRVGRFFTVDQGTGSVTFNAALVLTNIDGIGFKRGVRVNEFSNDATFTDAVGDAVPTQTAVEGYINARLGRDRNGNPIPSGSIIPSGGGYIYKAGDTMEGVLNMGSNRISNVAAPLAGGDAANKQYVDDKTDELNDIGDVTITGTDASVQSHILAFTGSAQSSVNAEVTGDIGLTYTSGNTITASISSGVIVNADVNANAAIDQSKLNMNAATTRANATGITQADRGLASFDSANFEATNGWVGIKAGGVANAELANSSLTIGTTSISLGSSSTTLAGMQGVTFTSGSLDGTVNINITGSITHTGNIIGPANSGADNGVNIGSSTNRYNTVWATIFNGEATSALYADLAENYLGDASYEPGTVLVFGGEAEVTVCTAKGQTSVAGVVTTNPAHLMNSALQGDHVVGLALQGRVPCKVIGKVRKGDMLVTSGVPGYAIVNNSPGIGQVIGKAVGTKETDDRGVVEVVVGRV